MSSPPFIKFYPSDFLGGTSGLSPAERGVYITVLCLIFEADGPIPRDDGRLARRCGMRKAAFLRVLAELMDQGKIVETGGLLMNDRAEKALMDRQNRTQIATHAAQSRWSAPDQKGKEKQRPDNAVAMPEQCTGDANQKPEPDIEDTSVSSSRARKRASRLPVDWVLPQEWGEWAMGEGWPEQTIRREADKFKDYWIAASGQKATKLDWFATWRNWLRNVPKEVHHGNGNRGTSGRPNPHSTLFAAARSLAGDDDGGSAEALGGMRDVTPSGSAEMADGSGGDTSQSFLRIIDGRS